MAIKRIPEVFRSDDVSAVFRMTLPSGEEQYVYGVDVAKGKDVATIVYGVPLGNGHGLRIERIESESESEITISTRDGLFPGVYTFTRTEEHFPPAE